MVDYGCEAWKDYNDVLQDMVNKLQNRFSSDAILVLLQFKLDFIEIFLI